MVSVRGPRPRGRRGHYPSRRKMVLCLPPGDVLKKRKGEGNNRFRPYHSVVKSAEDNYFVPTKG